MTTELQEQAMGLASLRAKRDLAQRELEIAEDRFTHGFRIDSCRVPGCKERRWMPAFPDCQAHALERSQARVDNINTGVECVVGWCHIPRTEGFAGCFTHFRSPARPGTYVQYCTFDKEHPCHIERRALTLEE